MDQKKFLEHFKKCGVKFTNERTLKKILADGKPTFYKIMGYGQMDDLEVKIETAITFDKKGKLIIAYWNEIL